MTLAFCYHLLNLRASVVGVISCFRIIFIALVLFVLGWSAAQAQSVVAANGALSVNGNQIVNQYGRPVSFAGNSLFWSNTGWGAEGYYQPATIAYLQSDWNASIVRAAMGVDEPGGYLDDPAGNRARVEAVIDAAIEAGVYVIVDWHSHRAEQNQAEAIAFFESIAQRYGDTPHLLYEIYNEPIRQPWSTVIKPYAQAVASAIRQIDPDNLILVGSSTWSQDVDIAAADPLTGLSNIAYTAHFYAGTHGQALRNKIDRALELGVPVVISEWGSVNANGDGDVATESTAQWMDFLRERGLSHLNWSVHNKAEGASVFLPQAPTQGGWTDDNLTASGKLVKQIVRGWQQNRLALNAGLSGAWYRADTPGQGWLLDVIDVDQRQEVFLAWFTYDASAQGEADLDALGSDRHRWLTASGEFNGSSAELTLYRNSGGVFNNAQATESTVVGRLTLSFESCIHAQLTFDFDVPELPDETVSIQRLSPDAFCRSQLAQAR